MADKMDPQEAIKQLTARAQQLQRNAQGQLTESIPATAIQKLFGKDTRQIPLENQTNWFESVKTAGLENYVPQGGFMTPEGTPFVDEKMADQVRQLASQKKQSAADMPSKELGEALKAKALDTFGADHERYKTIARAVDAMGGIPLSRIAEVSSSLTVPTKEKDLFKDADGLWKIYDRGTETVRTISDRSSAVLERFKDPVSLGFLKSEMKGFETDPVVKDARKQIAQLTSISSLVEGRNPASLGILASNIAKGLGREAGVLTEGDIARATGSQQLGDRWKRFWAKHVKGQLSDTDVDDYRALMLDINKAAQRQVDNVATNRAGRLGRLLKQDPKELKDIIAFGTEFMPTDEKTDPVSSGLTTADRVPTAPKAGVTKSGVKFKVIK